MKVQSSENKLVITEEFIFDQNKLPSDPNNHFKVRKMAKVRNRYNQELHLTQDTNGKNTNSQLDITNEGQEVSLLSAGNFISM